MPYFPIGVTLQSGILKIKPNYLNMIGRFTAGNPTSGYLDTTIITGYTPNDDPLKDGKFILGGF